MDVRAYIESGVLESYVLGSASPEETHELLQLKQQHQEIADALLELENDFERLARHMAIIPPPGIFTRIEDEISSLVETDEAHPSVIHRKTGYRSRPDAPRGPHFIEVEASSNQMRIHKAWRWVFAGVFLLGKLFLIAAIYYFLEYRQAHEQIQQLKIELRQYKH